eukprot:UN17133
MSTLVNPKTPHTPCPRIGKSDGTTKKQPWAPRTPKAAPPICLRMRNHLSKRTWLPSLSLSFLLLSAFSTSCVLVEMNCPSLNKQRRKRKKQMIMQTTRTRKILQKQANKGDPTQAKSD